MTGPAGDAPRPGHLLVRRPSPALADGELTHLDREPVDAELALRQWQGYVDAFAGHGWTVHQVEPVDDHPDGVFVEDTVVVFDDLAVLTSPGAASRRGEVLSTEAALAALPAALRPRLARIEEPGHLDGGDVLKIGRTAYVGLGTRTDEAGIAQLATLLEPRGWQVVAVPVTKVLHLKSGVTALPDGTVVGFPPLVDDVGVYASFLAVPEEHGTAVVDLGVSSDGRRAVIMSADAPRTAELYAARGLEVVPVPITEFEKLEGCVTCLSVRLRRTSESAINA
ncbi:MAG TPA: arginine deiminase family protein [Microlunatus sp.]|nr:arginine deiminase family protein [Microlunatus sp.]